VLSIDITGVAASDREAEFQRLEAMDIAGIDGAPDYQAFWYQETDLTRYYLAYVATNARGNLLTVSSSDGGQFNEHNSGGRFARIDAFTRPTLGEGPEEGLFSYYGSYAGIFVPGEWADPNNPREPGLRPVAPWSVAGEAQINGDFRRNFVEGGIVNRELRDRNGDRITSIILNGDEIDTTRLADLTRRETSVDAATGQFLGDVEFYGAPDGDVGDYAGLFGGLAASDVAAVLWLNPIEGQNGIWEYGALNLPRCDLAGSSPLCLPR